MSLLIAAVSRFLRRATRNGELTKPIRFDVNFQITYGPLDGDAQESGYLASSTERDDSPPKAIGFRANESEE